MPTRRPLRPIAEQGVFYKEHRKTIGEKIDDAIFKTIVITFSIVGYPIYRLAKFIMREK